MLQALGALRDNLGWRHVLSNWIIRTELVDAILISGGPRVVTD